jgi:hypothetical protein
MKSMGEEWYKGWKKTLWGDSEDDVEIIEVIEEYEE